MKLERIGLREKYTLARNQWPIMSDDNSDGKKELMRCMLMIYRKGTGILPFLEEALSSRIGCVGRPSRNVVL